MNQFFIRRGFVIGYLVALAIICFFAWYTYYNMKKAEADSQHEEEILQSLKAVDNVLDDMQDMEASQRGFIISNKEVYLEGYLQGLERVGRDTAALKSLLIPGKSENDVKKLLATVSQKVNFIQSTIEKRKNVGYDSTIALIQTNEGLSLMGDIRVLITKIEDDLRDELSRYSKSRRQAAKQTTVLFIILSVFFVAFLVAFFIIERREIRRRFSKEVALGVDKGIVDFRDILDRINDGFIAFDKNWNYVYVNTKASEIIGKPKSEIIGTNVWELYSNDVGNNFYDAYHQAMDTQKYVFLEANYKEWGRWFENHIYPSPRGISIYFKDITEKKKAESRLEEINEKFNTVAKATSDILWEADLVENTLWLNDNFFEKFGYKDKSQFANSNTWENYLHPDDKKRVVDKLDHLMQSTNETVWIDDYRFRKEDGSYLNIYDRCFIIRDVDGKPVRLIGSMTDVTSLFAARQELQKKEEQYKTLVEQATDGIFIADPSGKFVMVNSAGMRMSQYSMEELRDMTIYDLAEPEDLRSNPFHFEEMKRESGARVERKMLRKDGTVIDIEVNAKFLSDGRFLSFIRDITERKKVEHAIKANEKQLDLIYNTTTDILFLIAVEKGNMFRFESVNRMFETSTGVPKERIVGKPVEEVIPRDSLPIALNNYKTAIERKETVSWEEVSDYPSGRKTGTISITPFFDDNGVCTRLVGSVHDITERKKAESSILRANERFELIAKTTNDALWEWEFNSNNAWGNEMHQALYGLTLKDPVPPHEEWRRRIHPDDKDRVIKSYQHALDTGENVWISEYRFFKNDNEMITIYDRTYILRDDTGKPIRMMGSMMDISGLKEAEQQILKGKDLADKLIDSLPGVFYFYDATGKFIRWNAQLEKVTGYTTDEIAKMHPTDLFAEEDRAYITKRIEDVFVKGVNDAEAPFLTKSGEKIPYYFKAVLIQYEGQACLLGNGIDISERKQMEIDLRISENKYRSLVEQAADAIFIFNDQGNFVDVNTISTQLLGYSRAELINMSLPDILFEEDLHTDPVLYEPLSRGESVIKRRRFKHKNGTEVPVEVHSKKLPDGRYLGMVRNLSERIEAERQLQESYKQIRELTDHLQHIREEERAHIAREIHDELGQQLTVLKMDVSWLNKKVGKDDEVRNKLRSLTTMIDGTVKTVRRISSELRPSLLDDLGLVAAIDWHLKEFQDRFGVYTQFNEPLTEIELQENVKTGIFRIFQESLTNVARHAEAKNVRVKLQQNNGHIVMRIEDDGKGFNKLQVQDKRTLGILGMKERTTMMGGTYDINSVPGVGTVVVVSVPVNK